MTHAERFYNEYMNTQAKAAEALLVDAEQGRLGLDPLEADGVNPTFHKSMFVSQTTRTYHWCPQCKFAWMPTTADRSYWKSNNAVNDLGLDHALCAECKPEEGAMSTVRFYGPGLAETSGPKIGSAREAPEEKACEDYDSMHGDIHCRNCGFPKFHHVGTRQAQPVSRTPVAVYFKDSMGEEHRAIVDGTDVRFCRLNLRWPGTKRQFPLSFLEMESGKPVYGSPYQSFRVVYEEEA